MKEKLIRQTAGLMILVLALFLSGKSNVAVLERGAETVLAHMSVNYTAEDMKRAAAKGNAAADALSGSVSTAVSVITGKPVFGEPIDETYTGNRAAVYAVGGGQVTAAGENEEIGKYVKITHSGYGESLYGNLKVVSVSVPSNVKKGQVIGVYEKTDGKEFYYSFKEFK